MNDTLPQQDIIVECTETIDRPADEVWKALVALRGAAMPESVEKMQVDRSVPDQIVQRIQLSDQVFMEQRMVERDDALMVVRMEMTRCAMLPWSAHRSTFRVESQNEHRCKVYATCLATPTSEARVVENMLRTLLVLGLRNLKSDLERTA